MDKKVGITADEIGEDLNNADEGDVVFTSIHKLFQPSGDGDKHFEVELEGLSSEASEKLQIVESLIASKRLVDSRLNDEGITRILEVIRDELQKVSESCDPEGDPAFWKTWNDFEARYGTKDTQQDMVKCKRSAAASFKKESDDIL